MEFMRRRNGGVLAAYSNQDVNKFMPVLTLAAGSRRSGALPIIYLFVLGFCLAVSFILNWLALPTVPLLPPMCSDGRSVWH